MKSSLTIRPANPMLEPVGRPLPRHVGVVGAGSIGPDIAYYLKSALPGLRLTMIDIRQQAVDAALERLHGYAEKAVTRGKMDADAARTTLDGLQGSTDYDTLRGCDWVIEAASEDLALKHRIFADIEQRVATDAVITSNTSSLPAARIFAKLQYPQRATVTHFFAPAWRNPAVEVIDWPRADPALVGWLRRLFAATGKLPLVTTDAPCFMLDRIFDNWCNDAALLLDTATAADIDAVAGEFVHAGPFFVLNLAHGNPIITETNTLQAGEEGAHYRPAPIFRSVERWNTGPAHQGAELASTVREQVRERLLGVLLSQTVDILDRGIGDAADLDLGCRIALGFRRGPLELMRSLGESTCAAVLQRFARERPGMPMPLRALAQYQPTERHILVDQIDDVAIITLRRPEALNTLHDEMTDEVLAALRRHENDPKVTGFVIVGYGNKAFCAGADIGRFPTLLGNHAAAAQYARDCSRLLVYLDRCAKPVVAALNAMALGGGFELAMRCHALVAERGAWMQLPEISLGIVPGIGAMVVPFRRWPQAAGELHGMLTQAERLSAERAHALGIVESLADGYDALIRQAIALVHTLRDKPRPDLDGTRALPASLHTQADDAGFSAYTRTLIESTVHEAAQAASLEQALEVGYRAFGASACSAAAREGISAFLERRTPDFSTVG